LAISPDLLVLCWISEAEEWSRPAQSCSVGHCVPAAEKTGVCSTHVSTHASLNRPGSPVYAVHMLLCKFPPYDWFSNFKRFLVGRGGTGPQHAGSNKRSRTASQCSLSSVRIRYPVLSLAVFHGRGLEDRYMCLLEWTTTRKTSENLWFGLVVGVQDNQEAEVRGYPTRVGDRQDGSG
jgi:hypothetical protein